MPWWLILHIISLQKAGYKRAIIHPELINSFLLYPHSKQIFQKISHTVETVIKKLDLSCHFLSTKHVREFFISFPQFPVFFFTKEVQRYQHEMGATNETIHSCLSAMLAYYTTEKRFKPWLHCLSHIHLFIRGESNPKYQQTVIMIAQKHGINTACVHSSKER